MAPRLQLALDLLRSGAVKPSGPMATAGRAAKRVGDTSLVKGYNEAVTPLAEETQDALVKLIGGDSVKLGGMKDKASRMAASDEALNLLKAVPGLGALYGTTVAADVVDQVFDPESTAGDAMKSGMDILGMGGGFLGARYGINRGLNRLGGTTSPLSALLMASGAGVGKMGSDAVQAVLGM